MKMAGVSTMIAGEFLNLYQSTNIALHVTKCIVHADTALYTEASDIF